MKELEKKKPTKEVVVWTSAFRGAGGGVLSISRTSVLHGGKVCAEVGGRREDGLCAQFERDVGYSCSPPLKGFIFDTGC